MSHPPIMRTEKEELVHNMQEFCNAIATRFPDREIHFSYSEVGKDHYTVSLNISEKKNKGEKQK